MEIMSFRPEIECRPKKEEKKEPAPEIEEFPKSSEDKKKGFHRNLGLTSVGISGNCLCWQACFHLINQR